MKLDEILELMIKAKIRIEDGHRNYALEAIDESIDELKKYLEDNKATKCMNAPAIAKEDLAEVKIKIPNLTLSENIEKEFWLNCYIAALSCGYANPPQDIADKGVVEFRKRLKDE